MCRWVVYMGHEPILLEDLLVKPKHSIIKQINEHYIPELLLHYPTAGRQEIERRNFLLNIDGFGVSWYTRAREEFGECEGARPLTYKEIRPPLNDKNFLSICANTKTNTAFGHIRATSGSPVVQTNNHPFEFGRHIFMHNGGVAKFAAIKRKLLLKLSPQAYANVFGTTDSEHMAALFFTHLGCMHKEHTLAEMREAMLKMLKDVIELIDEVEGAPDFEGQHVEPGVQGKASSINLAVTDGIKLVCVRYRNHPEQSPPSLYMSTRAGVSLNRKFPGSPDSPAKESDSNAIKSEEEHKPHVVISSEPLTYIEKDWQLIPKNCLVLVDKDMEPKLEPIDCSKYGCA